MKQILLLLSLLTLTGCVTSHSGSPQTDSNFTLGAVQKEIKIGMSGADVATALGSPNMVTTDEQRREVWVYDRISTESVQSSSSGWIIGIFPGTNVGAGGAQSSSNRASTTQKTLTVIIKFDSQGKVRDFAYHSSKF
ncbi:MAG: hypothetical protein OEY19_09525 [Gammaproteobacteria bacterium]|nr:hypothetical protein [Gammaproteobacteria bacterium]MDH5629520.1 hypothetical protein [Gammaproteobacteria bacterium]